MEEKPNYEPKRLTIAQAKALASEVHDRASALNASIGMAIEAGLDVSLEIVDAVRVDRTGAQPMARPTCLVSPHRLIAV